MRKPTQEEVLDELHNLILASKSKNPLKKLLWLWENCSEDCNNACKSLKSGEIKEINKEIRNAGKLINKSRMLKLQSVLTKINKICENNYCKF